MRVNGESRIGVYAERDLKDGDELFINYGYSKEHQKVMFQKVESQNEQEFDDEKSSAASEAEPVEK